MRRLPRLLAQAVLPALVLIGAFALTRALLSGPEGLSDDAARRAETVYAVTAADILLGDNQARLRAFGEVVAAEAAELRVLSPGEVIATHPRLQVGETVEAGAALVTIDPFAYEGAVREAKAQRDESRARAAEIAARIAMEESDIARLEEQLAFAERDLERAEQLGRTGTITDKAVEDRQLLVSQRQQVLEAARHTLDAEKARRAQEAAVVERLEWQVERTERALADTVLKAPFTGIVREEAASVGRLLAQNDVAVALIRADALDVRFVLSDQRYGRLLFNDNLFGAPVEVIWRIGDIPLVYTGTITRAAADIDSARGGVDVFARLDMGDLPLPRPGAFVEVRLQGVVHETSARVPTAALHDGALFLIGADSRLVSVPVNVLALDGDEVIVEGDLEDGDTVITTRLAEAGDGIKVNRVDPLAAPSGPADEAAAGGAPSGNAASSSALSTHGEDGVTAASTASGAAAEEDTGRSRRGRRRGDGGPKEPS